MSIISILRNFNGDPNIVSMVTTNTIQEITTVGFFLQPSIVSEVEALNQGVLQLKLTDIWLIYAPNTVAFYTYNPNTGAFSPIAGGNQGTLIGNELRLFNTTEDFYTSLRSAEVSQNIDWVLPLTDGSAGQILSTDGAGNLSFINAGTSSPWTLVGTNSLESPGATVFVGSTNSLAFGALASAGTLLGDFDSAIAMGANAIAENNNAMAIGSGASATGNSSVAIGAFAFSYGARSYAIGWGANVNVATDAVAIGRSAGVNNNGSFVCTDSAGTPGLQVRDALPNQFAGSFSNGYLFGIGGLSVSPFISASINPAGVFNFFKGQRIYNPAGTFYAELNAGAMAANVSWTLPLTDGAAGQFLQTDGNGNLTWATP